MKTPYPLFIALAIAAIACLFVFDVHAAVMVAPALMVTEEGLAEIMKKFKAKTDEVDETREDLLHRMGTIEQEISKQLKGIPGGGGAHRPRFSLDLSMLNASEKFKAIREKSETVRETERFLLGDLSFKALFNDVGEPDSVNGTLPSRADQIPGWHGFVLRRLLVGNLLPTANATSNSFDFVRLGFTGAAGMQDGEGAEKDEMEFDGNLETGRVQTVAVHTTTSTQVLEDNDTLQLELTRILMHNVRDKIEQQLLVGSGTGANLEGIYTASTLINTPFTETPDRIGSALSQMETTGYSPNVVVLHPEDWFAIQIMKDSEGRYLYGDPASPAPPSLWNRPIVTNPYIPQGMALVADTSRASVRDRLQPTVYFSRHHKDNFTRNLVTILVEARLGLAIYDENAFRRVNLAGS